MASIAGEEDARGIVVVIKGIDQAVAYLVDGVPSHHLHIDEIRRVDLVGLLNDLLDWRLADLAVVTFWDDALVDVDAAEVAALARDVEDRASLGVDGTLGAPIWEVGIDHDVHDAPRVVSLIAV